MENKENWPVVDPNGFCAEFDRCDTSLIEEPETCDVCNYYCDRDSTCRCGKNKGADMYSAQAPSGMLGRFELLSGE